MSDPIAGLRRHQRFILDDDDLLMLGDLAKPRVLTLADQRTPQELSNEAWEMLGMKHGFVPLSVRPDPNSRDLGIIQAVPIDPKRKDIPLPPEVDKRLANDTGD